MNAPSFKQAENNRSHACVGSPLGTKLLPTDFATYQGVERFRIDLIWLAADFGK